MLFFVKIEEAFFSGWTRVFLPLYGLLFFAQEKMFPQFWQKATPHLHNNLFNYIMWISLVFKKFDFCLTQTVLTFEQEILISWLLKKPTCCNWIVTSLSSKSISIIQGISYWSVISNSALISRRINYFIEIWFIVGLGGLEIWVSSTGV